MPRRSSPSAVGVVAAFACLLAATSCDTPLSQQVDGVDRIVLTPSSANVQAGATVTLMAVVLDAAGSAMRDRKVVWASEDAMVATVSQSGVVTGVAAGEVQVAASSGGKSASAAITVTPRPVSLVRITPMSATISVTGSIPLQAEALDASGAPVLGRPIAWTSSNETIAIVSANGVVAGLASGSVIITATVDGRAGTAAITVAPQPVASVVITPSADTIVIGGRVTFRATALDAQNLPLADRIVVWGSNNPVVATVSSDGEVFGIALGSARIRATVEGKFADATIVVQPIPVARVFITPNQITLNPGQTSQLTVTLNDSAGNVLSGRSVVYTTSDAQIATVSATGLITAVAEGSAQIGVSSEGKTATTVVTVNPIPVASITITPNAVSMRVSETTRLVAQAFDAQGKALTNRTFTWSSDAPSVASVSQSGDVTAVGRGTAAISASTGGQTRSATVTVDVAVASMTIVPKPVSIFTSQLQPLTVQLFDSAGGALSQAGRSITWVSRDPTIASVSSSGQVGGVAVGTTRVVVFTPGASATVFDSADVTVSAAPTQVPVASVVVTPSAASIALNATVQLSAVPQDSAGNALARTISWVSLAPSIVSVSATGLVTANAGGSATIEARANGAGVNGADVVGTAAIAVTLALQTPVHTVTVTSPRDFVVPGDTMHLTVVLRDAQNNVLTGRVITFSSDDPRDLSVNSAGVVTGIASSGDTDIEVTSEGKSEEIELESVVGVASLSVSGPAGNALDLFIARNGTKRYTVTVRDGAGRPIGGVVIAISNSNPSVLSLSRTSVTTSSSGRGSVDVTAGSAPGSATIAFTAVRAGAIPPGTPGSNSPAAGIPIFVP